MVQSAIEAYEIRITHEIMADKSRKKILENIKKLIRTNVKKNRNITLYGEDKCPIEEKDLEK